MTIRARWFVLAMVLMLPVASWAQQAAPADAAKPVPAPAAETKAAPKAKKADAKPVPPKVFPEMGGVAAVLPDPPKAPPEPPPADPPAALAEDTPKPVPAPTAGSATDWQARKIGELNNELNKLQAVAPSLPSGTAGTAAAAGVIKADAAPLPGESAAPLLPTAYLKAFVALCIVLALILVLTFVVKRLGRHSALFSGPTLGKVLGRVYLAPRVMLYYVQTGGKVLVVGVSQNAMTLLAQFDAAAFEAGAALPAAGAPNAAGAPPTAGMRVPGPAPSMAIEGDDFLSQLRASLDLMEKVDGARDAAPADADVAELRGDIERLHKQLQESLREEKD